MKLLKIISIILAVMAASMQAQTLLKRFSLENSAAAQADYSPASNGIVDLIAVGDTVIAGTGRGISISFDKGSSWTNYFGAEQFGQEDASAIAYDNGIIYVATAHSMEKDGQSLGVGSGLLYSSDKGRSWTKIAQPVDQPGDSVITYGRNKIRALPVTTEVNNLCYDIAVSNGAIYIATFAGGLRKSTDMGRTWQRIVLPPDNLNSIKPADSLKFSLQPVAGKFGPENHLNHRVFSVTAHGNTVYVGTADGINKSTDGGISWTKYNRLNQDKPISGNFVVALAYNKYNGTIWASTWKAEDKAGNEFYGISYSKDEGFTWQTALYDERVHNFGLYNENVFAASDNGVFRTTDGGANWSLPGIIIDSESGINLSALTRKYYSAAMTKDMVYLGSDKGMARLEETGALWRGNWKVLRASEKLASKDDAYAFPNPFSPDDEKTVFKYSTAGKSSKVTIRVFDFGMNLIRTVIQNAERKDDASGSVGRDYWDGKDANGSIVPNGVYFYRIDVEGREPVFGKIIVLM